MRSRRHSAVELHKFYSLLHKTTLLHQDPNTGLFPGAPGSNHAWIRDNVYITISVWALSMAYKKCADYDEDKAKAFELSQTCIKCMRGLLKCFLRQREKIERFKETNDPADSIHAKFCTHTGLPVVGDTEWGHLQIDAISLYLLVLSQMIASGLNVIHNLTEVALIQNLVHYIESAYCIPDYGIWERGDKSNTGITELNASSIGMAVAALQALDELNLFGICGGTDSIVHVMLDEVHKNKAVLHSMLPRESLSKEADSALLTVIGYPAFAVEKPAVIEKTMDVVMSKLNREYGCIRFLRDGYKTPREDSSRLHYEPWELCLFENIECQWPLFYCFLVINGCFSGKEEEVRKFSKALDRCIIWQDGVPLVPELYALPKDQDKGSSSSLNNNGGGNYRVSGRVPMLWAQSLYVVGNLLSEGHLAIGELDPVNRRLSSLQKPETIVQVVILAQNKSVQEVLKSSSLDVKTVAEVAPVEVHPARVLSKLFSYLGKNEKLGLSGRRNKDIGILMTSKLYKIQGKLFAFAPQRFDFLRNYMDCDTSLMVSTLEYGLNSLATCWSATGRPTITLILGENMLDNGKLPKPMGTALNKMKHGLIAGTRVIVGDYDKFQTTSCVRELGFLNCVHDGSSDVLQAEVAKYLTEEIGHPIQTANKLLKSASATCEASLADAHASGVLKRKMSVRGTMRRSIQSSQQSSAASSMGSGTGAGTGGAFNLELLAGNLPRRKTSSPSSAGSGESRPGSKMESRKSSCDDFNDLVTQEEGQGLLETSKFSELSLEQLVEKLAESDDLEEQTDILHYLVLCFGLKQKITVPNDGVIEVRDLLRTLYETAVAKKQWGIVRHCAGYLGRRVDDLSKAVTDMVVRQKQVTVGMPPFSEVVVSGQGATYKSGELRRIIHEAHKGDESVAMLSQELLVYLAMFIQTEPKLFHGMLRVRVGLIIQVMAEEMQRSLRLKDHAGDKMEELMSLSPYEMRNLLHHIMSGKEFEIKVEQSTYSVVVEHKDMATKKLVAEAKSIMEQSVSAGKQVVDTDFAAALRGDGGGGSDTDSSDESGDSPGSWIRRRRLDGALNRVPPEFYSQAWDILQKCNTIVISDDKKLENSLTQAMTRDELKFALMVENVMNTVPEPEYRQMLVEALVVLAAFAAEQTMERLDDTIDLAEIVAEANRIFLEEQRLYGGDATLCCVSEGRKDPSRKMSTGRCRGARGICKHFYDSAPVGQYGTVPYITRGLCNVLQCIPPEGYLECTTS